MTNQSRPIAPQDFTDRNDRRVLTDAGAPGMDGRPGYGTASEIALASVASVLCAHGKYLDNDQLDEILRWVDMYKSR